MSRRPTPVEFQMWATKELLTELQAAAKTGQPEQGKGVAIIGMRKLDGDIPCRLVFDAPKGRA